MTLLVSQNGVCHYQTQIALVSNGETRLCIAQLASPNPADIACDVGRTETVNFIESMLGKNAPHLADLAPQASPVVFALPEYATSSSSWQDVDDLVREYPYPLVLLVGFGATKGGFLNNWEDQSNQDAGGTERIGTWQDGTPLSSTGRYNGTWCWIHEVPGTTKCIAVLKNYADQNVQPLAIPDLELGRAVLCVETEDLFLFPLICADVLCTGATSPLERIRSFLRNTGNVGADKKVLITGQLLTPSPYHELWQTALGDAARVSPRKVVVAIANYSTAKPEFPEERDKWRALSGVFVSRQRLEGTSSFPAVRPVRDVRTVGHVVRSTEPCVTSGPIRWTYGITVGNHLWWAKGERIVEDDGTPQVAPDLKVWQRETLRLTCRVSAHLSAPSQSDTATALLKRGLEQVNERINACSEDATARTCQSIAFGVTDATLPVHADSADTLFPKHWEHLTRGVCLAALLIELPQVEWNSDAAITGQLVRTDDSESVLVWCSGRSANTVMNMMQDWVAQPTRHRVVRFVVSCEHGQLKEGDLTIGPRADVTSIPSGDTRSASEPRLVRGAVCIDAGRIENLYSLDDEDDIRGAAIQELFG